MADPDQSMSSWMAARIGQMKGVLGQSFEARMGARIAALRKRAGLDRESVGDRTGIGADRMHEIEAGLIRAEALEIYDIAVCLDVAISDIFKGL